MPLILWGKGGKDGYKEVNGGDDGDERGRRKEYGGNRRVRGVQKLPQKRAEKSVACQGGLWVFDLNSKRGGGEEGKEGREREETKRGTGAKGGRWTYYTGVERFAAVFRPPPVPLFLEILFFGLLRVECVWDPKVQLIRTLSDF